VNLLPEGRLTGMSTFDAARPARLYDVMAGHVDKDLVSGVACLASVGDEVEVSVAGCLTRGEHEPVRRDSVFRIASMTKPIVAVAALLLVEECRVRLEDPVDDLLPELADRPVLVDGRGTLDGDTVPAARPITVHDVLTFRLGLGSDFSSGDQSSGSARSRATRRRCGASSSSTKPARTPASTASS
jgi:CubicO group peptidase (beta-lactamase class C family)